MLSAFRIVLIPVYVWLYQAADTIEDYHAAALVLAASCLTDMVDGKIARKYNMISQVGKVLDPLADKLTQLAMLICLTSRYRRLRLMLVLFLIKEFWQLFAMLGAMQHGKALDGALMSGKISTTVLFVSLILMVLLPDLPAPLVSAISLVCLVFLLFAFGDYILAYFGKNKKIYDLE
jgi:cardiolipin synthase